MQISVSSTLTLYHSGQFWVGIVEHVEDGQLSAARIVFGAEPSNEEIFEFVANRWRELSFCGGKVCGSEEPDMPKAVKNPKRRMREAARALSGPALSTKAQQALSEQRSLMKERAVHLRGMRKQQKRQERFELRVSKRKQRHRGH